MLHKALGKFPLEESVTAACYMAASALLSEAPLAYRDDESKTDNSDKCGDNKSDNKCDNKSNDINDSSGSNHDNDNGDNDNNNDGDCDNKIVECKKNADKSNSNYANNNDNENDEMMVRPCIEGNATSEKNNSDGLEMISLSDSLKVPPITSTARPTSNSTARPRSRSSSPLSLLPFSSTFSSSSSSFSHLTVSGDLAAISASVEACKKRFNSLGLGLLLVDTLREYPSSSQVHAVNEILNYIILYFELLRYSVLQSLKHILYL